MIPIAVIRPQPGCDASVAALTDAGFDARGFPLFAIQPVAWETLPPDRFDALLLGSANALRHRGDALAGYAGKPAYAVGETTAEAARAAGLDVIATGAGGLQDLATQLAPGHRRLLRLCGEDRVPLSLPPGVAVIERVVYASRAQPMPEALAAMLRAPALVLLHSGEAGRHFASECARHAIDRGQVSLAVIGPRVSEAAGGGWARVEAAETPSEAALLAFLAGIGLTGWLAWNGDLDMVKSARREIAAPERIAAAPPAIPAPEQVETPVAAESPSGEALDYSALGSVETRIALMEDRIARLDREADATSGSAARADGLLVAFAARRLTERGERLGAVEDQLKLRFANSQPRAVDTVIAFARNPVTLDQLGLRLDAIAPQLSSRESSASGWDRIKREFAGLFKVRRDTGAARSPEDRLDRARLLLMAGRVDRTIEAVESLPNAGAAASWIAMARRYVEAQRALDLLETSAMIEPLPRPAETAAPLPTATPTPTPEASERGLENTTTG